MNYFLRNNLDDFNRWVKHIAPYARADLIQFKSGKSTIIYSQDYEDALNVKRQIHDIEALLDEDHAWYLEQILECHEPNLPDAESRRMYHEIFHVWQTICFPKGKSQLKTINPVLLGGELRRMRIEQGIPAKHVAGLIGIAEKTLYSYEEGTRMMRVDTFYKICQIYKADSKGIFEKVSL